MTNTVALPTYRGQRPAQAEEIWYPGKLADASLAWRFWERVDRSGGPDACWPWTGYCTPSGYGQVRVGGKKVLASRLAYELFFGKLAPGMEACHDCDNPPCCNPRHLFAGTRQDNADDMTAKGRATAGARNGRARLTAQQVGEIRERYALGGVTLKQLAQEYQVHFYTIGCVVNHKTWRDSSRERDEASRERDSSHERDEASRRLE